MRTKRKLTPEEEEWLREHYEHTKNAEICKKLGMCLETLQRFSKEMGLSKSTQFMREIRIENCRRGRAVCRRNNWPPKGYCIPNSEKARLKPGIGIKDRMSERQIREMYKKCSEGLRRTIASEKRRVLFGLEQRTRLRVGRVPLAKCTYKTRMKKAGYLVDLEHNVYYYTEETNRRMKAEKNAWKHHIRILPIDDYYEDED